MNLRRIYAIYLRQLYLYRGNPTRVASLVVWLMIDITLWGFISRYLTSVGHATFDFVSVFLGAVILWGFVSRLQQGIMTSFLEDVWSQNFINFFGAPLSVAEYLTGLVVMGVTTGIVGVGVVSVVAAVAFGYNILKIGLVLAPLLLILLIFAAAMGIFVSSVIFRFGPAAEWLGWPVPVVLSVFAGVFYPIRTLPYALQIFAKVIPASYVFESVRGVLASTLSTAEYSINVFTGLALALVYLASAYAVFTKTYNRNLRTGAISRFSAESW